MISIRKKLCIIFLGLFCFELNAQNIVSQKLIPLESNVYDNLYTICSEQRIAVNADIAPCSAKEILFYLERIDYESLSDPSKKLYDQIIDYLSENKGFIKNGDINFGVNVELYPQIMYKSNENIDWTFGAYKSTTYTHKYYEDGDEKTDKEKNVTVDYIDASNYSGNKLTTPLASLPIFIDFANIAYISTTPFLSNSTTNMVKDNNLSNLPLSVFGFEFLQPIDAYFSTGYIFNDTLGLDFQIGKQGLQIGRSLMGSVIYNNTFQSDAYVKLDLYSKTFKYDMNVVEVDKSKYLYLHNVQFQPLNWMKFNITEGSLIHAPFELRFLNPLMVMHSYHIDDEYMDEDTLEMYTACNICSYLGLGFDIIPVKNLRLYFLYSQVELQMPMEYKSAYGRQLPNGFTAQLGAEYRIPLNNGWYLAQAEVLYSTPFSYMKTGEDWSMVRNRHDNFDPQYPIYSWLGSPFGSDTLAFELKTGYSTKKWNADFSYLFKASGENNLNRFAEKVTIDGKDYWTYYTSVKVNGSYIHDSSEAMDLWLHGNIEFLNRFTINGQYNFTPKLALDGQFVYTFVFNNNHIPGSFEQGVQMSLGLKYNLF